MMFAISLEQGKRLAALIGIGVAILAILIIPALRRSVTDSYKKGKDWRERLTGNEKPDDDKDDGGDDGGGDDGD